MSDVIAWVRGHPWETSSAVLGVALVAALAMLLFGQGDADDDPIAAPTTTTATTATSTTIPSVTTAPESPDEPTGSTTTLPQTPEGVTAVLVDNVPDVGAQIGLNEADLLVETPVEGGLSRFTAFYGEELPSIVGPVRSLRPVSADLLAPFDPVVFTTGGQPFVTGSVTAAGASIITPEFSIAFQSLERPQPHHVFVSPETEAHEGAAFVPPWEVGEWPGGESVAEVTLPLAGGAVWRYENDAYVRYRDGATQDVLGEVDGEVSPLSRETLILLVANQKSAGYTDGNGVDVPTFDIVGGGDLYVLHAGEVVDGTWFRASQAEEYVFTDGDGETIPVPTGALYLAILPQGEEISLGG